MHWRCSCSVWQNKLENCVKFSIDAINPLNKIEEAVQAEEDKLLQPLDEAISLYRRLAGKVLTFKSLLSVSIGSRSRPSGGGASETLVFGNSSICTAPVAPTIDRVKIPEFEGNLKEFLNFKALFEEIVHNNPNFTDSIKLYCITLNGPAAELIRDFGVGDSAYTEAWGYLLSRYENKRSIIEAHFADFVALSPIKNNVEIRTLLDRVNSFVRGLRICGLNPNEPTMSAFVSYVISTKLDPYTRRDWKNSCTDISNYPTFEELEKFLNSRTFSLEDPPQFRTDKVNAPSTTNAITTAAKKAPEKSSQPKRSFVVNSDQTKCVMCSEMHTLSSCTDFIGKNSYERYIVVKKGRLCIKCLGTGHNTSHCKSSNCKECDSPHHTLLHRPKKYEKDPMSTNSESSSSLSAVSPSKNLVILPTAVVRVYIGNRIAKARVLLDNCSQPNLVIERFIKKHRMHLSRSCEIPINGIGEPTTSSYVARIKVASQFELTPVEIEANVVPSIPYSISKSLILKMKEKFENLRLAEQYIGRDDVDMIIGGQHFYKIVHTQRLFSGDLCETSSQFGWVIGGPNGGRSSLASNLHSFVTTFEVDAQLQNFWKIEEVESISEYLSEQTSCLNHFEKTVRRQTIQSGPIEIGDSYTRALNSLVRVEKSFDTYTRDLYVDFMREYQKLGHIVKVRPEDPKPNSVYYIPHRAVLRPTSSTTRLRVVFNASAKSSTGISLNDALMTGPCVQPELFDTLIRFREHNIAFCADISKMYRRIDVARSDQDMQRIVWRDCPSDSVQTVPVYDRNLWYCPGFIPRYTMPRKNC